MEMIHGKRSLEIDGNTLHHCLAGYKEVLVDMGTGDGRFVQSYARLHAARFSIGLDACREQLRETSRRTAPNAIYLIANALDMPRELDGIADRVTINFPWGSLLVGLVEGDKDLLRGLQTVARPGALLEVRLNAGAVMEACLPFEQSAAVIRQRLAAAGFRVDAPCMLDAPALRACPTTWAKRLAFGRDPRALYIRAQRYDVQRLPASPAHVQRTEVM